MKCSKNINLNYNSFACFHEVTAVLQNIYPMQQRNTNFRKNMKKSLKHLIRTLMGELTFF